MALIYYAACSLAEATINPFKKPTKDSKLGWDSLADSFVYHPYLIRCLDPNKNAYRFKFIDCRSEAGTGEDYGAEHVVDLTDFSLVCPDRPSTLPTAADLANGDSYGFIFLSTKYMDPADTTLDGPGSGGGTGKHPIGADYYSEFQAQLAQARATIEALAHQIGQGGIHHLPPGIQDNVKDALNHTGMYA